ncbi:AraC-like DNA-binding protein [Parabacteroides sp. PF5-5]|uniref:AraC family transcriptional regulator n=1 Tax=unclassified Parabacteroides TaxID=2649774 RepID=UPI0024755EA3|nr:MULTISPECIES: AraC family transcriptional regulator [unclassified Parabacteroides]MDH6304847.1 AraC-like DNA-binding protein [Parabacteroides sp. PH5-39]MDH6316067.1 AraC-like DNA-binding protein [Parabacteroides sp. PF5-13]MDH6319724.1 AraC-like DNA-binding protein [Parabacteroides sp. PH5-13]MDH6323455.1 AraC-like DNA-binding protein [Parabacteroides sp. PH5-8]MDH6327037.1 AraC-like DNA-binding protein [Parabacteroides sp. PH5-41]
MNKEELNRDFILLNVGHAYHDADWNWKNVYSPFARIHFVVNGTAKIIRDDKEYTLKKNHLYLTPSYMKHSYQCDDVLELYYIHIYEDIGRKLSLFDLIDFPVEIEANSLDIHLLERLVEINPERGLRYYDPRAYDTSSNLARNIVQQKNVSFASELETQGILKQLISHFVAHASYKNEHIEKRILKSLHYIHKNLDKSIQIEHLAQLCFMTKDHFIRLFKKEMNITPCKYINQKKIEQAQLTMLIDDKPIKEIAYNLGFNNTFYFNRLFKKITNKSPGEYKKELG